MAVLNVRTGHGERHAAGRRIRVHRFCVPSDQIFPLVTTVIVREDLAEESAAA
jgi:hypothetical protein